MHNKTLLLAGKILAVTVFVATAAFAMIPRTTTYVPIAAEGGESAASAALYRAHCARCHGNDGHSNTKDGRRTEADDLTDGSVKAMATDKMTRIIKNGKGDMPANKRLSAAQIASIIRYVRGL
ncbi:MAG: cytochrome c [Pyrinomonadaceae bacterium]